MWERLEERMSGSEILRIWLVLSVLYVSIVIRVELTLLDRLRTMSLKLPPMMQL